METIDIKPNTDEWIEARSHYFCASDAPAMMGESPYLSREDYLHRKCTGERPEVSAATQRVFDRGHETEDMARKVLEMEHLADYAPVVTVKTVSDMPMLASLDGYDPSTERIFEHKLWNKNLSQRVLKEDLKPFYWWQLEHQLLVSGAKEVMFVCSDGTADKREIMYYRSVPDRRKQLIAGWQAFAKDMEDYNEKPAQEKVVASEQDSLPIIRFSVSGQEINSNIAECLVAVEQRANEEMSRQLVTDQDFADKEAFTKVVKQARTKLKDAVSGVRDEFVSFSEFCETADKIDAVLQKLQSDGERKVKQAKTDRKNELKQDAYNKYESCVAEINKSIYPYRIEQLTDSRPDFDLAMKGKRSIEGWTKAIDKELTNARTELSVMADLVQANLAVANQHETNRHLFNDIHSLLLLPESEFERVIDQRIAEYEAAEKKKQLADAERQKIQLEKERELIRKEEERKARIKAEKELREQTKPVERPVVTPKIVTGAPKAVTTPVEGPIVPAAVYSREELLEGFLSCLFSNGLVEWEGYESALEEYQQQFVGQDVPV